MDNKDTYQQNNIEELVKILRQEVLSELDQKIVNRAAAIAADEIERLQEENAMLRKTASQRGARMQIMRKAIYGIDKETKGLVLDMACWFDSDGVPL